MYSCPDYVDDTISALKLVIPSEFWDNPSFQADAAIAEISRLQSLVKRSADLLAALEAKFPVSTSETWSLVSVTLTPEDVAAVRAIIPEAKAEPVALFWGTIDGLRGTSLQMTWDQAESASHQGDCAEDCAALAKVPEIARQLDSIGADTIREALKKIGGWQAEELEDDEANRRRAIWLAAGDIRERANEGGEE